MAGEPGEAEVDQTVELSHAIVEILADAVAVTDEFAQSLGGAVMKAGGGRPLLVGESGQSLSIDGVGLGALEAAVLEAARHQGIERHDVVSGRRQDGDRFFQ